MNGDTVTIVVIFIVNENGETENVFAITSFDENFNEIVVDAIKKSLKWIQTIKENREYKSIKIRL